MVKKHLIYGETKTRDMETIIKEIPVSTENSKTVEIRDT